jgi:hypothetical protein
MSSLVWSALTAAIRWGGVSSQNSGYETKAKKGQIRQGYDAE